MKTHLYFLCPTDCLETVLLRKFHQENYFVTSLGNSIHFDVAFMSVINTLIEKKNIGEITFVLSDSNKMIKDAFTQQRYHGQRGLEKFYWEIAMKKKHKKYMWSAAPLLLPIISSFLMNRINELKPKLKCFSKEKLTINALVYNRKSQLFNKLDTAALNTCYIGLN